MKEYLPYNPFVQTSVGEKDILSQNSAIPDVQEINHAAFEEIRNDIEAMRVADPRTTRLRFLEGNTGAGKSHLFLRLQRHIQGTFHYAFVSNLADNPMTVRRQMVDKVISSLAKPAHTEGGILPFSQIHSLLYQGILGSEKLRELWPELQPQHSAEQLHEILQRNPALVKERLIDKKLFLVEDLSAWNILKVFLQVLDVRVSLYALEWLRGSDALMPQELDQLGVAAPLNEVDFEKIFRFVDAAGHTDRPSILILDQLDSVTSSETLQSIEQMLIGLLDNTQNWYVVVSLLPDKLARWRDILGNAFWARVGDQHIRLRPISDGNQIISLLSHRLNSPALKRKRTDKGHHHPIPFSQQAMEEFAETYTNLYARNLINAASEKYRTLCLVEDKANVGKEGQQDKDITEVIKEAVERELQALLEKLQDDDCTLNSADRDARVRELVGIIAPDAAFMQGALYMVHPQYSGTDTQITVDGKTVVRVVCFDGNTNALRNVVLRIVSAPAGIVLLRDASIAPPGAKTKTAELLGLFQKGGGAYKRINSDQAKFLIALGEFLASVREGGYGELVPGRQLTQQELIDALKQSPLFTNNDIVDFFRKRIHPEPTPPITPPVSVTPPPPPPLNGPVPKVVAEALKIIERSRFIAQDRLEHQLGKPASEFGSHLLAHEQCEVWQDTTSDIKIYLWSVAE